MLNKKYKFLICCLTVLFAFMLGKVGYSAYQIHKVQRFVRDFQNLYSQSMEKYTYKKLKDDISFVEVGRVPSFACYKLIHAYFPYPHRFYINNQYVSSVDAKEWCYRHSTVDMIFQFSFNKWSYAHRLECENNDDCRKGYCHLGFCMESIVVSDSNPL